MTNPTMPKRYFYPISFSDPRVIESNEGECMKSHKAIAWHDAAVKEAYQRGYDAAIAEICPVVTIDKLKEGV